MAKPKPGDDRKKGKKKNKKKVNPDSISTKLRALKPNPFETIWSRRKFNILGKKRRGEERRVGLARSLAIEKRKKTLLKDYERSGKSSVFVDKRIGEQNEELGDFDKGIMRSQRERQLKLGKKSKYNLSDGEEDELEIRGDDLFSERDDFDDEAPFDEEDNQEGTEAEKRSAILQYLGANVSNTTVETSVEGEDTRHKSKKEVFDELISKSKFFKAQRAMEKEESGKLMEQLDGQFASLVQSEALVSLNEPDKMNALKSLANKSTSIFNAQKTEMPESRSRTSAEKEKSDEYDKLFHELGFDMRARASDRTKTPEEIAQEEKERLEELEEERQKRMIAAYDSSDAEAEVTGDDLRSFISGDDLGDSFAHEEQVTKLSWIEEILRRKNESGESSEETESGDGDNDNDDNDDSDGDEEEEEKEEEEDEESGEDDVKIKKPQSLKDWEQSSGDDLDTDSEEVKEQKEEDDDNDDENVNSVSQELESEGFNKASEMNESGEGALENKKLEATIKLPSIQQVDLPYTIEAPRSFEELSSLLENRSNDEIVEAIRRIRTYNAIKVTPENRKKMQVFYGALLQFFAVSANKKPLNYVLLNLLVKPLMEMSCEIPYFSAICARQRLQRTRSQFSEDVMNAEKSCWPTMKTLFLLRLWSMIFPCSDFRHAVMTPAMLLMCEYLMRCPIISGRDVAIGSFLCSMVLYACKQSKKFCPEAILFLRTMLMTASDKKPELSQDSQFYHLMELRAPQSLLCMHGTVSEISPLDFIALADLPEDSSYFCSDDFKASILVAVVETLRGFINIYEGFKSFPEMFLPITKLLVELAEQEHMPLALQDVMGDVSQLIEEKAREHHVLRRPLQMRKQKPVPIKLLNPKFEENFVKGRDYDPDKERAERRKLQKLIKREAKGAARELKKDNFFLAEVKEKDKRRLEEERAEKYGRARAFLQEQEHAFKSGQLGKGRKRRR